MDYRALKFDKMTVRDWIKVEDNPIQRDTARHAAKAKHLLTPLPTHYFVFAAQLPSGKLIKLDGHTRAFLWDNGTIPMPGYLQVGIIPVENRAEAEAMYKTFDSSNALESMRDKVSGGFHKFNFEPESQLLKNGSITAALRIAYAVLRGREPSSGAFGRAERTGSEAGRADVYEMIKEFHNELIAYDAFHPTSANTTTGLTAAFIITYRKHGRAVVPFWAAYFSKEGVKSGGQMDGVQAVTELMLQRTKGVRGGNWAADICKRVVRGVEGWISDEKFRRIPQPMDLGGYLEGHHRSNERLLKRADVEREIAS